MKAKKENYSGPDLNDKFLRSIGFSRDPIHDVLSYNVSSSITYWINSHNCRIITNKKIKLARVDIIDLITRQVEEQTREKIRRSI